jgi:hypothetical protein
MDAQRAVDGGADGARRKHLGPNGEERTEFFDAHPRLGSATCSSVRASDL